MQQVPLRVAVGSRIRVAVAGQDVAKCLLSILVDTLAVAVPAFAVFGDRVEIVDRRRAGVDFDNGIFLVGRDSFISREITRDRANIGAGRIDGRERKVIRCRARTLAEGLTRAAAAGTGRRGDLAQSLTDAGDLRIADGQNGGCIGAGSVGRVHRRGAGRQQQEQIDKGDLDRTRRIVQDDNIVVAVDGCRCQRRVYDLDLVALLDVDLLRRATRRDFVDSTV